LRQDRDNGVLAVSPDQCANIDIRSDDVQEILSYIPHWIIRWGIAILFLTILMLVGISWIIKYPDIISSRITITTQTPPAIVMARSSGKLAQLFVKDKDAVEAGDYLAVIENPANLEKAFAVKKQLDTLTALFENPDRILKIEFDQHAALGELQSDFSNFVQNVQQYKVFCQEQVEYHADKIKAIEVQLSFYQELINKAARQKELLTEELHIARKKREKDRILFEKGLVSEVEFSNSESAYLQKQRSLEDAETVTIANNLQLTELQKTILDLRFQLREKERQLTLALHESYKRLQSHFAEWEQQYIMKAPIDGRVSFFKYWSENQFVNAGEEVLTIVPDAYDLIGRINLQGTRAGKAEVGQTVKIKFDGYPFSEFGVVEGQVASTSLLARDNVYLINVELPNGLKTNYHQTLKFTQGMQGTAEIITQNLRIFERIFNQFRYLLVP
jgi:multidrug resistance efflux pump